MAKVFGIHIIELHPGVKEDDFEKFWTEETKPYLDVFPPPEGWTWYLLKGTKGDRKGQYLIMAEVESVEDYERPHQPSEAETAQDEKFWEGWRKFSPTEIGVNTIWTDYIVVGEELRWR